MDYKRNKYLFSFAFNLYAVIQSEKILDNTVSSLQESSRWGIVRTIASGDVRRFESGNMSLKYVHLECGVIS